MAFDLGAALSGAFDGAEMGAASGNPYVAIAAALGKGAMDGFGGKKKSSSGAGDLASVLGGGKDGGFSPKMIMDILSGVTGGGGPASETPKLEPINGGSAPYMPPALLGFPSLAKPSLSSSLRDQLKISRGF